MRKPKVLLYWDANRKDLLEPFLKLKDEIDFVILWGDQPGKDLPFPQIYIRNYRTPYQLLNEVRPDKILFFNINSYPQIAVSLAASNRKIPRYHMHHGIHHADNLEINLQKEKEGMHVRKRLISNFSSLFFYFSALRLRNLDQVFPMIRFGWVRKKRDRTVAISKSKFKARLPDWYINLSPHNAIITRRLDGLNSDDRFIYIGHPFFDEILTSLNNLKAGSKGKDGKYFLLIDFPNKEDILEFKLMTADGKWAFYRKLSQMAASVGCRLKIKLHPFSKGEFDYKDDNTDLIREGNVADLIHHAEECFSFFSTLIIPIIYHKGYCYLFSLGKDRNLQKELEELGLAISLNTASFSSKDLVESERVVNDDSYTTFVQRYLYYADGKSTWRLKNILTSDETL